MKRSVALAVTWLALTLAGCASWVVSPGSGPASQGSASPGTPSGAESPTNFGSATRPNFGPQDP